MTDPIQLGLRRLTNGDISKIVEDYRQSDSNLASIPVNPESHLEFQLGFDIIPTSNLHDLTYSDSYLSVKTRKLWVDERVYVRVANRYRFSLAHEIGHIVLHSEIIENYHFDSVEQWISFINAVDSNDYEWLESQANRFAACLLAPMSLIEIQFQDFLASSDKLRAYLNSRGINGEAEREFVVEAAITDLSRRFIVSREVMEKRFSMLKLSNYNI